jgi:hypothetical protein
MPGDNDDLLKQALAIDPETFDPDAPENALPPEIEARWPEISERIWQRICARLDAEGWTHDDPTVVHAPAPKGLQ